MHNEKGSGNMDDEKFNLVNEEEVEAKSYEELLQLEEELMNNPNATSLDLAYVSAVIIDREEEMGIDNTIPWEQVIDELLKGTEFENNNKKNAQRELLQIKWYIEQDSEFYANKTVNEINKRIQSLLFFPEMGRVTNKKENVRQIIYKSYKILYRFNSNKIYILHIIHHSRDISNLKF